MVMSWELGASLRQGYLGVEKSKALLWGHGDPKLDSNSFTSDPPTPPQDSGTGSCYVALDDFKLMAILLP